MDNNVNRAVLLYQNWESKKSELMSIGAVNGRDLSKIQYNFLKSGLERISLNPSADEKLCVKVLESTAVKIRRQIYPNLFIRVLHRIKDRLIDKPSRLNAFINEKESNISAITKALNDNGITMVSGGIEQYLDYESLAIKIPVTSQVQNDKTLDIDLHLVKYDQGDYKFKNYSASLTSNKSPTDKKTMIIDAKSGLTPSEVTNLLEGRPVQKNFEKTDGFMGQKWIQLDLNNTDQQGHQKTKEYHSEYGFDLKGLLLKHAGQLKVPGLKDEKTYRSLTAGNKVSFTIHGIGEFTLQANLALQTLDIYNKANGLVSTKSLEDHVNKVLDLGKAEFKVFQLRDQKQDNKLDNSQSMVI